MKEQKEYWKSKYNIEIEKDWLVNVLILQRDKRHDTKDERVVILRKSRPYTYPLEMLKPNKKKQRNYKVIVEM